MLNLPHNTLISEIRGKLGQWVYARAEPTNNTRRGTIMATFPEITAIAYPVLKEELPLVKG